MKCDGCGVDKPRIYFKETLSYNREYMRIMIIPWLCDTCIEETKSNKQKSVLEECYEAHVEVYVKKLPMI